MLTGGSGDGNLEPIKPPDEGMEATLTRVRTLLKCGVLSKGGSSLQTGKEKDEVMSDRWKVLFQKYDSDGSGILKCGDVRSMVRRELKISERLLPDNQLQQVFDAMDADGGGFIEFKEFMSFISQKVKRITPEDEIVKMVGRCVRLAMSRAKMNITELEHRFRSCHDMDPVSGELGPEEVRRFFRNNLNVSSHECSDRNLGIAFHAVDTDGSGTMSPEEFMEFIRYCFQGCPRRELPARVQGLIGGMGRMLPHRLPRHRPGTKHNAPVAGLPFCLNGRDLRASHRLGAERWRWPSHPLHPAKQHASAPTAEPCGGSDPEATAEHAATAALRGSAARGMLTHTLSGIITAPNSPHGCLPPLPLSPPGSTRSNSVPVLPAVVPHNRFELQRPPREWTVPRKPLGDYKTFKGAHALNRVEQQLFEVGVDARGQYHRLR